MDKAIRRDGTITMQRSTMRRLVLATLLVALGMTTPAAAVDLSGDYVVTVPTSCRITVVQTGTAYQTTGFCDINGTSTLYSASGTVDPVTGAFSASQHLGEICPPGVISGTGDGEVITATSTGRCYSGPIFATKCGNGVIDPLENCEDGNHADGDCCSARCRLDSAGTACTSDSNDCTDAVCNATGRCTHVPSAGPCDDGNACTIGDACVGGACVPGATAPAGQACNDDSDPCTADVCGAGDAAGTCTHVPVPPAECRRAVACHSTCTQQLKQCRQQCPGSGQARRECRAACAERSTCTAPGAPIHTLAYVVTECRTDAQGLSGEQKLLIRRGNCDPVTVPLFPLSGSGTCVIGDEVAFGVFQRTAVLPHGSGVVFEVTNEFSLLPAIRNLELRDKGMFFVRADGRGLRRLGDASRSFSKASVGGPSNSDLYVIAMSPDGRTLAFSDLGPGPDGRETDQIFALDIATGGRRQLTHRQATNDDLQPRLSCLVFLDDRTITFCSRVFTMHPPYLPVWLPSAVFTVQTDGSGPEHAVGTVAVSGGAIVPQFQVTGTRTRAAVTAVEYPEEPTDHFVIHPPVIAELYLLEGRNVLQLTDFDRGDTARSGRGGALVGHRVFFDASADPFGANPDQYCQIFSVNTRGVDLRQVTHLRDHASPSGSGCYDSSPGSCSIDRYFADQLSGTIVFTSDCDPVGENPSGYEQVFSMRPDGSGLRQLTRAHGPTNPFDGTVSLALGPFAYQ